ncbi:HypC/HybG/HupF family hydrogenase formation chaperone [Hoyosella subflava]|uniref:Hydrogenase assembly chaperone HypC/HupF n=1 Tax=Hoyosella subflava (strain DSM 45089 / JCM 17490 / NBRC 109087 / DQS3-9A1) TaxID=443218 RepID=F6ENF8_HOYSD|nr:HypC/HybG/HupF family hydrogenase formation chaperone [Hoyosella subflava]AEF40429.1 Hydrogenase assembly chaperone HypC/HupF [Hoyosella subflava DQS3-9A1]
MCLGIPGQVQRMLEGYGDQLALVDVEGELRKVNIGLLSDVPAAGPPVSPGEWVIIHMGFAVERATPEGAAQARAGLELLGRGAPPQTRGDPP